MLPLLSIFSSIPFTFFNIVPNGNGKSNGNKSKGVGTSSSSTTTTSIPSPQIIKGASILIETRTLDTLLRILWDRLLSNARRLSRSEKYLTRRINYYRNDLGGGLVSKVLGMIPASSSFLIFRGTIGSSGLVVSGSGIKSGGSGGNWKSGASTSEKSVSTTTHIQKEYNY